jgi:hypothetical protein
MSINFNLKYMDDESRKQDLETNIYGKCGSEMSCLGNVLQSFWVRCGSILSLYSNRKFNESKFNFVLRFGILLWIIFLIQKAF